MGNILLPEDLTPFTIIDPAKAEKMIADAEALAVLAAPCISDPEFVADPTLFPATVAILRGAILRWNDAGAGAVTQSGAGPFQQSVDTRTVRRSMFWPSEIKALRSLCSEFNDTGQAHAFSVDTAPTSLNGMHLPWCSGALGANYCSCGVSIAGFPIYEGGPLW